VQLICTAVFWQVGTVFGSKIIQQVTFSQRSNRVVSTRSGSNETMTRTKVGVPVRTELVDELDTLVDECADLGASRSEIVEADLTAYSQNDEEQIKQTRELIIRNRKRSYS
jgi:hypothetical protein